MLILIGCGQALVPPEPTVVPAPTVEIRLVGLVDEGQRLADLVGYENPSLGWRFDIGDGQPLLAALASAEIHATLIHHIPRDAEAYWFNPVALDGLVIAVHPDNPVRDLTLGQVQAIFNGRIDNWSEVGGADAPIVRLIRGQGSGVREIFDARVMGAQRVSVNTEIRPNTKSLQTAIANEPTAIGITTFSSLADSLAALAIDGVEPSPTMFAAQQYPLTIPLYWVSLEEPAGELRGILAYLQSDEGQAALAGWFGRIR